MSEIFKFTGVTYCHKASVNLNRYFEAMVCKSIFGDMGERNDSLCDILLKNIDKKITINFNLLTTPVKEIPLLLKHLPFLNLKTTLMKIMTK